MQELRLLGVILFAATSATTMGQSNIDPGSKFAWSENVGWTNWRDADDARQGVVVSATFLSGYIWAENVGWVNVGDGPDDGESYANIDATNFGVNVLVNGDLDGFAWSENIGWVNFGTSAASPNQASLDRVALRLRGYAWAENGGWINLDDTEHFVGVTSLDLIPTVSEWGLVVMCLLTLTAGTMILARRRQCRPC